VIPEILTVENLFGMRRGTGREEGLNVDSLEQK